MPVEQEILSTVSSMGVGSRVADVVREVSRRSPPAQVREAYWRLVSDNRLTRSADGRLYLPDVVCTQV